MKILDERSFPMGGILINQAAAGWRRRNRLELSGMIFDGHDRRLAPSLQAHRIPAEIIAHAVWLL